MHKAHVTTPETVRDMNPSANSIVQRTENGKKNLENIAFRENSQDGRFSLKKPVEETEDLIAVHNISESKLKSVLELGGFPMLSIAIVRADAGHSEFGDISVVFRKDMIDPEANYLDGTVEQAVEKLGDHFGFIESYTKDKGIEVEYPVKEKEPQNSKHNLPEMRKFVKEHGITADMLVRDGALRAEYLEILKRGFSNQRLAERAVERARRTFLENRIPDLEKMEQDFDVIRNGGTEPDEVAYRDNLRKIVREDDGELTGDFVKYTRDMIEPSVLQKGVRNGRDRFDRYGNENQGIKKRRKRNVWNRRF